MKLQNICFSICSTEPLFVILSRLCTSPSKRKDGAPERGGLLIKFSGMRATLLTFVLLVTINITAAIRDRAVIQAKSTVVKVIVRLLQTLVEGIQDLDRQIEEAVAAHLDFFIFDSLPGAGPVMVPRLLAAFGSQHERFGSAREVQSFSGIAPVTERSGKMKWVHSRWACPKFLRQSFHEWAGHSIAQSAWARAYYQQQRKRGKGHHAAVRALVFKWIRVLFRCWKDGIAYDESKYLAALAQRGSPLSAAPSPGENPVKSL